MSKREAIKTKKEEIISYWKMRQSECGLSVDWEDADQRCWRCGCESKLERCHIIPYALGGKDEPEKMSRKIWCSYVKDAMQKDLM